MQKIKLDHESYAKAYEAKAYGANNVNKKDYNITEMMKYGLLRDGDKNRRLLSIGPGPDAVQFIEQTINHFEEIVLLEVNPIFTKSYKKQDWYLNNKNKIKIYENKIENVRLDNDKFPDFSSNSFDIIFVNHVIYHFRLSDITNVILPKLNKLLKSSGYSMVSVEADTSAWASLVIKRLKPKYDLRRFFKQCLENDKYLFFELVQYNNYYMAESEAKELFKMFAIEDLYRNPDYHNGDISDKEIKKIELLIDNELYNIVEPVDNEQNVVWRYPTNWFVIKKRTTKSKL